LASSADPDLTLERRETRKRGFNRRGAYREATGLDRGLLGIACGVGKVRSQDRTEAVSIERTKEEKIIHVGLYEMHLNKKKDCFGDL
jgi:hypothetical protein